MPDDEKYIVSVECNNEHIQISHGSMYINPESDKIYIVIRKCGFMKYLVLQGDKVENKPYGCTVYTENTYISLVDEDKYSMYYKIYNGFKTIDAYDLIKCKLVYPGNTSVAVDTVTKVLNSWLVGTGLEVIKSCDKDKNIISAHDGSINTEEIKSINNDKVSGESLLYRDTQKIEKTDTEHSTMQAQNNFEEHDSSKNESIGEDQITRRCFGEESLFNRKIRNTKNVTESVMNFNSEHGSSVDSEEKIVENPFGAGNGSGSGNKLTVEYLKEMHKKRLSGESTQTTEKQSKDNSSDKRIQNGKEYKTRPFSVDYDKLDNLLKNTNMPYSQIASELGCSLSTVSNREKSVKLRAQSMEDVKRSKKTKLDDWLKDENNMEKFKSWAADDTISLQAVAEKVGCSPQTVRNVMDRLKIEYVAVPKKKGLKHKSVIND